MGLVTKRSWLISSAAIIALTSGATAETSANLSAMTVQEAAALIEQAVVEQRVLRKLILPSASMFAVHAPGNSGVTIKINGQIVVDASGTRSAEVGEAITGILSLQAGDHAVEIGGVDGESAYLAQITVNAVGATPETIFDATTPIAADEADAILAARSSLDPTGAPATTDSSKATEIASAFSIGGGSSGAASAANAVTQAATKSVSAASTITNRLTSQAGSSGSKRRVALSSSLGRLGAAGSMTEIPTNFGGGDNTPGNPSDPDAPPPPPPPPPPQPMESVSVSPLAPPTNVTVSQAIQLTAAGNENGQVANTGATLFGGVMDGSIYDQIDVTVGPVNRETTVDVGPETGQFAVRLFEEDFANGAEVTVTLTGASSADENITSDPVSYTVTGIAPTDGVTQALSRLTFGPTPALYARLRGIGFEAFVEEQLNPASIDDRAFRSMQIDRLLNRNDNQGFRLINNLYAREIGYAAYSPRQLQEVMANFWYNHFYASAENGAFRHQATLDRDFFRQNAFGNFEDMLLYSARSPLMSNYLNNDRNRRGRINENYAREILELHSVGVDAGYGPDDIIAVARIFTGWGHERSNPNQDNASQQFRFRFRQDQHDTDDKFIPFLDMTIEGLNGNQGVNEGEELITILSQHPSTRSFVCGKLVQLLVADMPPQRFINACTAAWQTSGGNTEALLRAILLDPQYIENVDYTRTKGKTPFEYSVSVVRSFGARPNANDTEPFYRDVREVSERSGYNLLRFELPTGLAEVGSEWSNSATMAFAYNDMNDFVEKYDRFNMDMLDEMLDAGLETAEEFAAYLLTVSTADRYTQEEFDAVVTALKNTDGIFEPRTTNEERAVARGMGLVVVTRSFQLQ